MSFVSFMPSIMEVGYSYMYMYMYVYVRKTRAYHSWKLNVDTFLRTLVIAVSVLCCIIDE